MHWEPYFKGRTLGSITKRDLREFSLSLTELKLKPPEGDIKRKGKTAERLSSATIGKIMLCGTTALIWAFNQEMIPVDPSSGLIKFSGKFKKRGILTLREAGEIFKVDWKNDRARIASRVAMTTGMRAGEILALRKSDIDPENPIIYVRHSFSPTDGLKSTKNEKERLAPLFPEIRAELAALLAENPFKDKNPDPYIFYSTLPDKPLDEGILLDSLKAACKKLDIDPVARNIVFHSWRHFFASKAATKLAGEQVRKVTGHLTEEVYEEYAGHVDLENIKQVMKEGDKLFGKILQFKKGA
jgi:integrase